MTRYPPILSLWRTIGVTFVALLALCISACTSESSPAETTSDSTTTSIQGDEAATEPLDSPSTTATGVIEELHPLDTFDAAFEGALLGVVPAGVQPSDRMPRLAQLEADAGRTFDIGHVFHSWDKAIPTVEDLAHIEKGRVLMISWNGTDTREIAGGVHDEWIRSQAAGVRDLDTPVMLRWLWEMDGNRRRAWVYSGADYIAAWNHIRAIFVEEGATNAQFVWCPNEFLFEEPNPEEWYPGDDNVDWLCADGYNWPDSTQDERWRSLDEIFGAFLEWAEPRDLPIILGETGSNEALDVPGAKGAWLRALPKILQTQHPEVDAIIYFDKDFRDAGHADWRLDTSDSAYDARLAITADPYFNAPE